MSNDAKLGLVIGIGLVILIAIVFHRRDPAVGAAGVEAKVTVQAPSIGSPSLPTPAESVAATASPRALVPAEPEALPPLAPFQPRR